ncbi:MAG: cation transporter [Firmicutes bacterium]|nr:cation transporter [Bacillota bacterium]
MDERERRDSVVEDVAGLQEQAVSRSKIIIRTSIIGILANLGLAAFKMVIGLASNSIAIILDAVNNMTDMLSSVITIIGTRLAGKAPDRKHPLGHGRTEYITALLVAGIVLYAGITSLVESIKKIINPEEAEYTVISLIIIAAAVFVKLALGHYVKGVGVEVNSGSLIASGSDATFDALISASVLASAIIFLATGLSLEAYVGVMISLFIIKSGIEMVLETVSDILGKREDGELVRKIKEIMVEDPDVLGAFDLILYNYGPEVLYGSVHVEVSDTMTAAEIDEMDRRLVKSVLEGSGVYLTGISIYSQNTTDPEIIATRTEILKKVMAHPYSLQMHGFYINRETREMRFDVVLSFDYNRDACIRELTQELGEMFPDYSITIVPDLDITDV